MLVELPAFEARIVSVLRVLLALWVLWGHEPSGPPSLQEGR